MLPCHCPSSVRDLKAEEVPVEVLKDIISTARRAPSWENSQPWSVYIAAGETLAKIREAWADKYAAKVKGSPGMPTGHRICDREATSLSPLSPLFF